MSTGDLTTLASVKDFIPNMGTVSTFDALSTLTEVPVVGADALDKYCVESDLIQSGSKFFYVYGGYLYVIANGTIGIPGWAMPSRARVFRLPI